MTRTVEEFGRIDGLCNAAGITTRGTLLDTTPELFDHHIAVNLRGPFFTMQAAVADMGERGTPGHRQHHLNRPSSAGKAYLAPYVAAKAGLAGLTRNAAHAHRWDRIRINGLDIGGKQTEGETTPSEASTTPTTTGPGRRPTPSRWASSANPTRSPRSSCSCSRPAAEW